MSDAKYSNPIELEIAEPSRRMSPGQVIGLLKTEAPAPTDAECERIVEEERLRKYG